MTNTLPDLPTLPPESLTLWQASLQWQPTAAQHQQLEHLYQVIWLGNRHVNLTSLLTPETFWEKHLWDSVAGLLPLQAWGWTERPQRVIDIGTGGGFPGLPVAILYPQHRVTLLDSTQKKVQFLGDAIATLGLNNAESITGRAEAVAHAPSRREQYDVALIRAVAAPPVCVEYALPFLAVGGIAVLYQGHWTEADSDRIHRAAAQVGGELLHIEALTTPLSQGDRHCIYLKKIAPTPHAYPRTIGVPKKNPLA
ncbi:16S rRNA (guanine(527)-N(7))-methyltransferase RsmG [Spirulina major CS-329]|uniref:16S rRNA (guanine(527)-N(7))-methyltransferase RsmG n=1 Tax=Spirulina TaxID=1154 RepID=UPI00232F82D9|nr:MULTISPECIES: 16S rRNA (guanine(527)-N(7))-methyltransferase RsmG [Spirulina]MDB9496166.1 16S rRNA (guanine(527)-N(7))-methyltransferase RsmG [Spirulina subsalsa CS-330]MDB9501598.1 16S rRNA (guanine(527)-N(7))-methyltransferase RsmG [Spirulina major CS-329]